MLIQILILSSYAIIIFYLVFIASIHMTKLIFFSFDKVLIFFATWYYLHQKITPYIASGKAVWFWDICISSLAVILYTVLFFFLHQHFRLIGKIINLIISFFGTWFVYGMLSTFAGGERNGYIFPLLNNSIANQIANYVFILILSLIVWIKRESVLNQTQLELNSTD